MAAGPSGQVPLSLTQRLTLHPYPEVWARAQRIERLWVFDVRGMPSRIWRILGSRG